MPILTLERQELLRRRYAAMEPGWRPSSQVYQDLVAAHITHDTSVLDVGCGRGGVLERLHAEARFSVGVDPDSYSLREHRAHGLTLTAGLAEGLPFASSTFEVVICSWVLEHLRLPEQGLAEFARVLRPGGSFVFLTPNSRSPLLLLSRMLGLAQRGIVARAYGRSEADTFSTHYRANTSARIDQLALAVGLSRVLLHAIGDPTYLAFTEPLFRLGCLAERIMPAARKVHLLGDYVKM